MLANLGSNTILNSFIFTWTWLNVLLFLVLLKFLFIFVPSGLWWLLKWDRIYFQATLKDFVSRRSHGSVLNMQVGLLSYILVIQFLVKPKLPDEKIFFNHGPWYLCAPSMVSISLNYTYILDWPLNNKRKLLPHVAAESHGRYCYSFHYSHYLMENFNWTSNLHESMV